MLLLGGSVACSDGGGAEVDANGQGQERLDGGVAVPVLDEPNPPGVPRPGWLPAVAVGDGLILTADDALQAEFVLRDREGALIRRVTPSRRVSRPQLIADGSRFWALGEDCAEFELLAGVEPVCRPGGFVLMSYDPASDGWILVAEGIGEGESQVAASLVGVSGPAATVWVRSVDANRVIEIGLEDGAIEEVPPPPAPGFGEDDQEVTYAVCEVDGAVAVFSAASQQPATRTARVDVLDEDADRWSSFETELDPSLVSVGVPLCAGDGIVVLAPDHTLAFRDGHFVSSASVPDGGLGLTITTPTDAGLGVWTLDGLWLLPSGGAAWQETDVRARHVLAAVQVDDRLAVLQEGRGEAPPAFALVRGPEP